MGTVISLHQGTVRHRQRLVDELENVRMQIVELRNAIHQVKTYVPRNKELDWGSIITNMHNELIDVEVMHDKLKGKVIAMNKRLGIYQYCDRDQVSGNKL